MGLRVGVNVGMKNTKSEPNHDRNAKPTKAADVVSGEREIGQ
jgi:hypothetical protein